MDLKSSVPSICHFPCWLPPEAGRKNCKCDHIITGYLAIGHKCKQGAKHPKCNHVTGKRVAWSFTMPRSTLWAIKHPFHCCCDCVQLLKEESWIENYLYLSKTDFQLTAEAYLISVLIIFLPTFKKKHCLIYPCICVISKLFSLKRQDT